MILDSSAVVAIVLREPGYERLLRAIAAAPAVAIGAPTLAETSLVLATRLRTDPSAIVERILSSAGVEIVPFGPVHAAEASRAFQRFGKGRHPAALNFGDCLSYAVAKVAEEPLLAVGDDFPRTDLELAPIAP